MSDVDFEDWIAEARRVTVADFCRRRSIKILLGDQGQPCPGCAGVDRFSVNLKKNKWYCRKSGFGGDALGLAMHIDGTDFIAACETLTGRPPPGRAAAESAAERRAREERLAREARERAEDDARQARVTEQFREDERARAWKIWRRAVPALGTPVEAYLAHRGLSLPAGARLKFAERLALWDKPGGEIVHEGPAMVAAIERPDGRFGGVHQTWIDLSTEKGKASIFDAKGKELPSKKVRGSKKGGSILLRPAIGAPRRLMIGEGIETVISVLDALAERNSPLLEGAEFLSSVDLDNLCGKAKGRVRHPTETKPDVHGRERAIFVGAAEVDFENDWPLIYVPESVEELFLLGDGDSEAFATRLKMERAGKRFSAAHPKLAIYLAMSRAGDDFNKMRMTGRVAA